MPTQTKFAGFPSATLYELGPGPGPPAKLEARRQLLWGDFLTVLGEDGDFFHARVRGSEGWIRKAETQDARLLEIVFVDIGQGDGALLITPDDQKFIIDAGEEDNMVRFLRWRFGKFAHPVKFDAAIMSHSDSDHYGGFDDLFAEPNLSFETVYHNGLMERKAAKANDILGVRVQDPQGPLSYITDLVPDMAALQNFLATPANFAGKQFPTMLQKALAAGKFTHFQKLDAATGHLPGHGPGSRVEIQILGPFTEQFQGQPALRWLGDPGKTKNGHSVVLRLVIGRVSIFLGGDLNTESCRLLLEKHTGLSSSPKTAEEEDALVRAGRAIFGCDVAKACHHGSADLFLPFMKAVNPVATVISSGDNEPHAHPRADALGAIGRCGRGERPLIFSTELSRSAKEAIKHPVILQAELRALGAALDIAEPGPKKVKAQAAFDKAIAKLERSIAIFGAINLRTDGEKVVMAYKVEVPKPSKEWDMYVLEPLGLNGPLGYQSKHN
jgi:beta-lactamase superfamily II metal-dependent hydrolase